MDFNPADALQVLYDSTERFYTGFMQLLFLVPFLPIHPIVQDTFAPGHHTCTALKHNVHLANTTIIEAAYLQPGAKVNVNNSCFTSPEISVNICRVVFDIHTSEKSQIRAEAWLPDRWYGRFLALGNGGLNGCIDYSNSNYGTSMHFATVASDNGHDGPTGVSFLNNPETLNDFAHRAIHLQTVVGKALVKEYYGRSHHKSYYMGCSTGGRQGTQSALLHPADFDGILAGAPAVDFNHLMSSSGIVSQAVGSMDPDPASSPRRIPPATWVHIKKEIFRQCDAFDNIVDGIITEPDNCNFRPEAMLCKGGSVGRTDCLTAIQVEALRTVYSPVFGTQNNLIYPRRDPGSEEDSTSPFGPLSDGSTFGLTTDWFRYAVYNDSDYEFTDWGMKDIEFADKINPGRIATFDGDLSAFHKRGGKFLAWHGRSDGFIPSGNSKRMYNLISRTLSMANLDSFYRLFLVPGMYHCGNGLGAPWFGQNGAQSNKVNRTSHNALLALVDWVEGGHAPDTIIGSSDSGHLGESRTHCRYPMRSVRIGRHWLCDSE